MRHPVVPDVETLPPLDGLPDDHEASVAETAAYIGRSPGTLSTWRSNRAGIGRRGPAFISRGRGRGHKVTYRAADIREWLASNPRPAQTNGNPVRIVPEPPPPRANPAAA